MELSHAPTCKFIPTGIVVYNAGVRYVLQETKYVSYSDYYAIEQRGYGLEFFRVCHATTGQIYETFGIKRAYRVYRTELVQGTEIISHYTRVSDPMLLPRRVAA